MARFNSNQIISKVTSFGSKVVGTAARKSANRAEVLKGAKNFGRAGVPQSTITRAERTAKVDQGRTFQSRVKTGVGAAAVATTGFLGLHKYHQHVDNKILERIDKMYNKD